MRLAGRVQRETESDRVTESGLHGETLVVLVNNSG